MIYCGRFAFVHMPKTGGTWVRDTIRDNAPSAWSIREIEGHVPAVRCPVRDKVPMLGIVRNPWDWYVSEYFFRRESYRRRRGWWSRPRAQWQEGMRYWATVLDRLPDGAEGFRRALSIQCTEAKDGIISNRYREFFCDDDGSLLCEIGKYENIRNDTIAFLRRHGVADRRVVGALRSSAPKNASRHPPYRECYDEASRKLVERIDAEVIERYGYEF